jgi:hypothetical protein
MSFLDRLIAFICRCFKKGDPSVKPDVHEPTSPQRTARPVQPAAVLYVPGLSLKPDATDAELVEALGRLKGWKELAEVYGGIAKLAPRRAFKPSPGLEKLINRANENAQRVGVRGYRPLDTAAYVLLSLPRVGGKPVLDSYCELKARLSSLGAQVSLSMPTRPAQASNDYLSAAVPFRGIHASPLVSAAGRSVDGTDQWLVDVEKAWLTQGIAANTPITRLPLPANVVESAELGDIHHGTAVAGIVLGAVGSPKLAGIAPNARFIQGPCLELSGQGDPSQILAATILEAAVQLSQAPQGTGVLLIQQETWDGLPIETLPLEFAAIQTAAAAGHIVVQPAGNAGIDLDAVSGQWFDGTNSLADRPLNPNLGGATSGAVTVAAAGSGHDPAGVAFGQRSPTSNWGLLVDGWAWGDSIAPLGVTRNAAGDPVAFADPTGFGGTSGAAAILAGAALLMQQLRRDAGRAPLHAGELRALLKNTGLGTPGLGELSQATMPDLAQLKPVLEQ